MELNSRQQEIMIERVNMLWRNKSCTMCGGAKWTLSGKIFEMREFQGGNLVLGGESSIYPVIPITCGVCGNTHFLNPLIIGVLDNQSNSKEG